MLITRFTKLVGCTVPIQQAGMGAASPPELAAAVSEAGAIGMLGTARAGLNPTTLAGLLDRTRALTDRPFGVNFIIRPGSAAAQSPREFVEQAAKVARVVEFFYSDPSAEFVRIVHDHGALASWQVGSSDEAGKAAEVGCDIIVAQGMEAGGHVRGTVGLWTYCARFSKPCRRSRFSPLAASAPAGRWRPRLRWERTAYAWERGLPPPRRPTSIQFTLTPLLLREPRTVFTVAHSMLGGRRRHTACCVLRSMQLKRSRAIPSAL